MKVTKSDAAFLRACGDKMSPAGHFPLRALLARPAWVEFLLARKAAGVDAAIEAFRLRER